MDGRQIAIKFVLDAHFADAELVLEQRQRFLNHPLRLTSPNSVPLVREKFSS